MTPIVQGDILSVERISAPVLVVSKTFFNRSEQVIACPILQDAAPDPLHIPVSAGRVQGIVLCEQVKLLDLRVRGFRKLSELRIDDIMNITDAIQSIFDYYPFGR